MPERGPGWKLKAVRFAALKGMPVAVVAQALGVSREQAQGWAGALGLFLPPSEALRPSGHRRVYGRGEEALLSHLLAVSLLDLFCPWRRDDALGWLRGPQCRAVCEELLEIDPAWLAGAVTDALRGAHTPLPEPGERARAERWPLSLQEGL